MEVDVFCGAEGTVTDALEQWNEGELEKAVPGGDFCGHEHGDGHSHRSEHSHSHSQ